MGGGAGEWSVPGNYYLRLMRALVASPQLAALLRGWAAAAKRPVSQKAQEELEQSSLPWIAQVLATGQRVGAVREDLPPTLLIAVALGMGEATDVWLMSQRADDDALPGLIASLMSMIRGAVGPRLDSCP